MLCIGLDPDAALMPDIPVAEFNKRIIEATADLVCAYKPNAAFYEAIGREGMEALHAMQEDIPSYIPIIGDAKRG
ncbi:MAG: orotidine 5'-phosphate decarboxylase, partial [Dehalococcoidia bacterium]|nr:orotidine 5'-phosphate decarboxylase [Dehalococcoidia bacterium]